MEATIEIDVDEIVQEVVESSAFKIEVNDLAESMVADQIEEATSTEKSAGDSPPNLRRTSWLR